MKPEGASETWIRDIQPGDFPAIRRVARETWAVTYRGIVPERAQDEFVRRAYSEEALARRMEGGVFLVAELNDEVIGFADFYSDSGEARLAAIYVLPNRQGRGIGTRLLRMGISRFPADMRITLRVERDNHPAFLRSPRLPGDRRVHGGLLRSRDARGRDDPPATGDIRLTNAPRNARLEARASG